MTLPTVEELNESIDELRTFRERLNNELMAIGKKLRMTPNKIKSTLAEHQELKTIETTLNKLIKLRDHQLSKKN